MLRRIEGYKKNKLPKVAVVSTKYQCQFCGHRYTKNRYCIIWFDRLLFRIPILKVKKGKPYNTIRNLEDVKT